jgi:hypothetical protein
MTFFSSNIIPKVMLKKKNLTIEALLIGLFFVVFIVFSRINPLYAFDGETGSIDQIQWPRLKSIKLDGYN